MNFYDMVLRGYFNNREYLSRYFFREFKKAEKEHYEADEFFSGCLRVVEAFEYVLDRELYEDKKELYTGLNESKRALKGIEKGISESKLKKRFNIENNRGLTYEQLCRETISECETKLTEISRDDYFVKVTWNEQPYDLSYDEVCYIKIAILKAGNQLSQQKEINEPPSKMIKESMRRPVAFCVCLAIKAGKFDISTMSKRKLERFIRDSFKDENPSVRNIVNLLCDYETSRKERNGILIYDEYFNKKGWELQEEIFKNETEKFPDDLKKALEIFERFK